MPWATTGDVLSITGQTVTDANVTTAQYMIEMFADVTQDADENLSPRDLNYLKLAVAYQAAFVASNANRDLFSRIEVSELNQDGTSFKVGNKDALMLSPWANRALDQLSWFGSGSITIGHSRSGMSFSEWSAAALRDEVPGQWVQMNLY